MIMVLRTRSNNQKLITHEKFLLKSKIDQDNESISDL